MQLNLLILEIYYTHAPTLDSIAIGHAPTKKDIPGVTKIKAYKSGYCLAIALARGLRFTLNQTGKNGTTALTPRQLYNAGVELAQECGLQEIESVAAVKRKFLSYHKFAHLRVIVVPHNSQFVSAEYVFKGINYTFKHDVLNNTIRDRNTIWLYKCRDSFDWMNAPLAFFREHGNYGGPNSSTYKLCEQDNCLQIHKNPNHNCTGRPLEHIAKKPKKDTKKYCNACNRNYKNNSHEHVCYHIWCSTCYSFIPEEHFKSHRCPIKCDPKYEEDPLSLNLDDEEPLEESFSDEDISVDLPDVWAWDIESMFKDSASAVPQPVAEGYENEIDELQSIELVKRVETVKLHIPNLIMACNIRTGEFETFTTMPDFLNFFMDRTRRLKKEQGKGPAPHTYLFAHNSSGYDSRLLFQFCKQYIIKKSMFRGTKILNLCFGNLHFLDSLRHIQGSLRSIVKAFLPPLEAADCQKGYFPYLANTVDNQGYIGTIPDESQFNPGQMKLDEYKEFKIWYDEQVSVNAEWNLEIELTKYCKQDVKALAAVLLAYETAHTSVHGISPLRSITSASVAMNVYRNKFMPANSLYCLSTLEHNFAHKALRGGRTDVKRLHYECPEDAKIVYRDVCSLYPYVMMDTKFEYPIGTPTIWLFKVSEPGAGADHYEPKFRGHKDFLKLKYYVSDHPTNPITWLQQPDIFGFAEISGHWQQSARTQLHPVLPGYKDGKCIFDLQAVYHGTFCTEELKIAITEGFTVDTIYRCDIYNKSTSLWTEFYRRFMKLKNIFSKPALSTFQEEDIPFIRAKYQKICDDYKERYNITMVPEEFEDNPSKKQTFKIVLNSLWGKFAQSIEHGEHYFYNLAKLSDHEKYIALERSADEGKCTLGMGMMITENTVMVERKPVPEESDYASQLARVNIAAAAFVPMYGRLELYKALKPLGDRVLMHDTDSIIAFIRAGENEADFLPPEGKIVGDWEMEDDEAKSKIIEWVGLAPKSYAMKLRKPDGTIVDKIKFKGITLNCETEDLVTFDALRDIVKGRLDQIIVPSIRFVFHQSGINMHTLKIVKLIKNLADTERKGTWGADGFLYPFGHLTCGWTIRDIIDVVRSTHSSQWQVEQNTKYGRMWWNSRAYFNKEIFKTIISWSADNVDTIQLITLPAIPFYMVEEAIPILNEKHSFIDQFGNISVRYGERRDVRTVY